MFDQPDIGDADVYENKWHLYGPPSGRNNERLKRDTSVSRYKKYFRCNRRELTRQRRLLSAKIILRTPKKYQDSFSIALNKIKIMTIYIRTYYHLIQSCNTRVIRFIANYHCIFIADIFVLTTSVKLYNIAKSAPIYANTQYWVSGVWHLDFVHMSFHF